MSTGDDGLRVRGGQDGVAVTTEHLEAGGAAAVDTAADLARLTVEFGVIAAHPDIVIIAGLDPAGAGAVTGAAMRVAGGPDGLPATTAGVLGFGESLRLAAIRYAAAELEADEAFHAVWQAVGPVVVPLAAPVVVPPMVGGTVIAGGAWVAARAMQTVPEAVTWRRQTLPIAGEWAQLQYKAPVYNRAAHVEATTKHLVADAKPWALWLSNQSGIVREGIATVPMLLNVPNTHGSAFEGSQVPELARITAAVAPLAGLLKPGVAVTAHRVPGPNPPTRVPANFEEAYRAAAATDRKWADGKQAPIVRIYQQGNRYIVFTPSTQSWIPKTDSNLADLASNIQMMARRAGGQPSDATLGTIEAMREAGIKPGDPVMLVGYSQGGGSASDVACAPELREEFTIEAVLTAGSPTSAYDYPSDVQVLSVENTRDWVPSTDGSLNPDRPNVTTVTADAQALGAPPSDSGHARSQYEAITRAVDRSDHGSVAAYREHTDAFLNGGEAEVIDIEIRRVQAD